MFIFIKGKGLYQSNGRTGVIFSQGGTSITTYSDGGGMGSDGVWGANVRVPKGLRSGNVRVEAEVGGKRSQPFFANVTGSAEPPKLTAVSAPIINPGNAVWIEGSGFSADQILEMRDAEGQLFPKTIFGVSTGNSLHFDVPGTAYPGIARFTVVDKRTGPYRVSNEISFEIRKGPIPLQFNKEYFVPLATGQWSELYFNDARPIYKASKVEVKLTQGGQVRSLYVTDFRRLHIRVPRSFRAGEMVLQTRTWIEDEVSEWSQPLKVKIVETPAKLSVESVEVIPRRAEAMFLQGGKILGILPIRLGVLPWVNFPEGVKRGKLEIYTRYWDKDSFSDWKRVADFTDFDPESSSYVDHPEYNKEKSYNFNPFFQRFYFENNSSSFIPVKKENNLVIYGEYYVRSVRDLSVLLENGNKVMGLPISEHEYSGGILVNMPSNIDKGDWRLWIINRATKTKKRLPVRLRFE
jgi:hypothetical protein